MRFALKVLSAALLTGVLSGCSDSNGTTTAPTSGNGSVGSTTNVTVTVTPAATQVVDAGQTVALTAAVTGDTTGKGVTWAVTPGGGTLASSTGLTNTYTAPSTAASATITATSVFDGTKSASTTVTINALPNFTASGQLAQGFVGIAYSTTLASTGGTGTRTYAIAAGSTLPAGLSLNTATGVISGRPTATGSSTFSATVTDSAGTPTSATASFSIGVSALQLIAPTLTNTVAGKAYPTSTYTAAFAQGAVTYAVSSGALPAGLALSSGGVLSGTSTTPGTANFTVTATDSIGQTASSAGSITVVSALSLTGATIPSTQANSVFAGYTIAATGGTTPYSYALTAGSILPAGLTLSTGGVISGTATQAGTFNFGVTATDSGNGPTLQTATAQYSLVVTVAPLSFTPATLPDAVIGSPYSITFTGMGGIAPYRFSVSSGSLPPGLILGQAGTLSGRVTTVGSYPFTVEMDDSEATPMQVFNSLTLNAANSLAATPNNSALNGSYAFVFTGQNNGALASNATTSGNVFGADMAGSLTFDGSSAVTGTIDRNSEYAGVQTAVAVTGSYAIGTDHRGKIVLQFGGGNVVTLDVSLSNFSGAVASKFRLIEADSDNAINVTQVQGSGEANLQTPSSFTMASLLGRYVFRLGGETPTPNALQTLALTQSSAPAQPAITSQFGALDAVGYIAMGGSTGLIARGTVDALSYNTPYTQISLTGSFTAPDAHGRGTMTITSVGNSYPAAPTDYIYYVINAKQLVLLSIDPHSTTSLMAGMAYQQQQTLYTASSLSGTIIGAETAVQGGNGTTAFPSVLSSTVYVFRVTSPGNMTAYEADNTNGYSESFEPSPDVLTYTVSDTGRVTFYDTYAPSAQLPVFWLYDTNKGVGTESENSAGPIGALEFEGLAGGPYTVASINGQYATGTGQSVAPVAYAVGKFIANPTSPATATLTQNVDSAGTIGNDQTSAVPFGTDSTGRFTAGFPSCFDSTITSPPPTICLNGYIVSPTKLVFFNPLAGYTRPFIGIAEQ